MLEKTRRLLSFPVVYRKELANLQIRVFCTYNVVVKLRNLFDPAVCEVAIGDRLECFRYVLLLHTYTVFASSVHPIPFVQVIPSKISGAL